MKFYPFVGIARKNPSVRAQEGDVITCYLHGELVADHMPIKGYFDGLFECEDGVYLSRVPQTLGPKCEIW